MGAGGGGPAWARLRDSAFFSLHHFFALNSSRPLPVSESERRVVKAVHTTAENYGAYAARPEELAEKAKQSEDHNYMSEELGLLSCLESHG